MDFSNIATDLDVPLLRALALGGKHSREIQLLLDSVEGHEGENQSLALVLADLSMSDDSARRTFDYLKQHQRELGEKLGRSVGMKTSALDLLEGVETALKLQGEGDSLTYYELEKMAFRDQLTGLYNYRYFSRRIKEEIRRAQRYRHQLSVLMLDIDHFKRFNDTHGHRAGNLALQTLSGILRHESRETDLVARYGGEEFVFILPETTKRLAHELAERVRASVASTPVVFEDGSYHRITASLGVATYPRDAWSSEAILECSDTALYRAKKLGRNRVSVYAPSTEAVLRYRPRPGEHVESVSVVGSFNGWDPYADPMHSQEDGSFYTKIGLIPASYEYKFLINGTKWIPDPDSKEFINDGYWGNNSKLRVLPQEDVHK